VFRKTWLQKIVLIVLAVLALACALAAQQSPPPAKAPAPEYKIPPEAAQKSNPVKPTSESLAKGKKMYAIDCAMCHGANGDGKGDMDMKNVTDFTNPDVQKARTDGEWFYIIRKGKGEMPPEGDRAKDEEVWNIVNYIRAFAKK
jgi:mono/diheme cytochrome c family protein